MNWINQISHWWSSLNDLTAYAIKVVVVLIIAVVISLFFKWVLHLLIRKTEHTKMPWDDIVIGALILPLRVFVWVCALAYLINQLLVYLNGTHEAAMMIRIFWLILLTLLGWFLSRFMTGLEQHWIKQMQHDKKAPSDSASIRALARLTKIVIWISIILVGLGILSVPISGLLTFGGVGGIALALGSKDLLANFTGGLLVYLNKHFAVGDWIYSPDRDIQGTVEYIGWRLTRIRGFDKRPIYVPNAIFNNIIVVNATRMTNRRIKQTIGVRYDDAAKVLEILGKIRQMLKNHPDIDQTCTTLVNLINFSAFNASSIEFQIYTFTKTTNWVEFQAIQDDVMIKAEQIITECGAECAFPTTTLHVPEGVDVRTI